jgi:CheY-like chemotaxis protein
VAFVVDDEKMNRTLMARVVRRWGFEVAEFDDGLKLVEHLEGLAETGADAKAWPVFVTLDMQMPTLDGCRALERMKSMRDRLSASGSSAAAASLGAIRVFGVTGNAIPDDVERMQRLGAVRVLTKPVEPSTLALSVKECLPDLQLPDRAFKALRH